MLIAGALCAVAAVTSTVFGLRALRNPPGADLTRLVRRMMAPTQLAAAAMLAAAAVVGFAAPPRGALPVLVVCVLGAVGTLTAGTWQAARYAAVRTQRAQQAGTDGCEGCDCGCAGGGGGQSGGASGPTQLRLMSTGWVANIDNGNG